MGLKRFILLFLSFFYVYCSSAQIQGEYVQSRILILLDESSSMVQPWAGGTPKYKAAHKIIMSLMDSVYAVNNHVEFGLRVFGHQHTVPENDCYDTKLEVPFSIDNKTQMRLRLDDIHPLGVTPIAFALTEAANKDLVDETHNAYSIILLTDGGESCGGDICDVMKKLVNSKVFFKPYILSLENDATLKTTYSCMGDFLQVTSDGEIPKAVKTIVDAFRPALRMTKTDYSEIQTSNIPSAMRMPPPSKKWKIPTGDLFAEVEPEDVLPVAAKATKQVKLVPIEITLSQPPLENTMPHEVFAQLPVAGIAPVPENSPELVAMRTWKEKITLPDIRPDAAPMPHEKLARIAPAELRTFPRLFTIEERSLAPMPVPRLPAIKMEKIPVAEPVAEKADDKRTDYKVETVDNNETTLEVYITNGAGKFYTTNPQILLLNPKTKEVVKRFYRYVGPDGAPDPQTGIPPGIYDLTFASNRGLVLPNVKIELNKKNKVTVVAKLTTLSFAYDEPPITAIKENWVATVTERNKPQGRVEQQKMNEKIKYEPGNYHIEINTFPTTYRNVDLDFDYESVINVDHPGYAKFTPTDAQTTSVTLYQRLGDKFVGFYTLNIGDPRSQHLSIQPGDYQAHFQKGPGMGSVAEHVIIFRIKPNEETTVELK